MVGHLTQLVRLNFPDPKLPLFMNFYPVLKKTSFVEKTDTIFMPLETGAAEGAVKYRRRHLLPPAMALGPRRQPPSDVVQKPY